MAEILEDKDFNLNLTSHLFFQQSKNAPVDWMYTGRI